MKNIFYISGFIILTIFYYFISTYVEYTSNYFSVLNIAAIIIGFLYSYSFSKHLLKKRAAPLIGFFIMLIHLFLTVIATEKLNDFLLTSNNTETIATIKDCKRYRKGSEYCIYYYSANNKQYAKRFLNEAPDYKYKNGDTLTIQYYIANPKVSRLK
jgi:hypothetical protein